MPVIDPLYRYWSELAAQQEWDADDSDDVYQYVTGRYDEEQRHFHTRAHLKKIFDVLPLDDYSPDDRAVLIATVFFHDAVYDTATLTSAAMNEENSAVLAGFYLRRLGSNEDFVARVETITRNSKKHLCDAEADPVGAMFLDCDMATLASTWEEYSVGSAQIDKEYGAIPCESFYRARLEKFIDPLLNAPRIYLLDENEAKWGDTARANLQREKNDILAALNGDADSCVKNKLLPT